MQSHCWSCHYIQKKVHERHFFAFINLSCLLHFLVECLDRRQTSLGQNLTNFFLQKLKFSTSFHNCSFYKIICNQQNFLEQWLCFKCFAKALIRNTLFIIAKLLHLSTYSVVSNNFNVFQVTASSWRMQV